MFRIASVAQRVLEELRGATPDMAARRRIRAGYQKALSELDALLSEDLRDELSQLVEPLQDGTPSQAELRVAEAQLSGWLDGLLQLVEVSMVEQEALKGRAVAQSDDGDQRPDDGTQAPYP